MFDETNSVNTDPPPERCQPLGEPSQPVVDPTTDEVLEEGDAWEHWFALYVRSHFEKSVEQGLKGKGYPAFSPFYQTIKRLQGRSKLLDLPLFPGYVFCRFNPNKRLPILTTPGIVNVLGAGNVPEPIELSEIRSVQRVAVSGQPVQPWPFLSQGHRIRIEAGPLSGTEGTLLRVKNQLRLVVSITMLQRSMAVEVDQQVVRPLF